MKLAAIPSSAASAIRADAIPPHVFFLVSAVFHYLGPAFAVLLFQYVGALGVAWLRIGTAALAFALWRRPWRVLASASASQWRLLIAMGAILAAMNSVFYLAIGRLPLGTVGAIEFLAPIGLAVVGLRSARNVAALIVAIAGVALLTDVRIGGDPLAYVFAFANCALFAGYIMAGHALARDWRGALQHAEERHPHRRHLDGHLESPAQLTE